jgi:FixJ family two-component response regulator
VDGSEDAGHELNGDRAAAGRHAEQDEQRDRKRRDEHAEEGHQAVGGQRYLPTNLSTREIANELYLSTNTVKTHQRHLYQKLGASSRTEAVERARALGLLPPSSRRP